MLKTFLFFQDSLLMMLRNRLRMLKKILLWGYAPRIDPIQMVLNVFHVQKTNLYFLYQDEFAHRASKEQHMMQVFTLVLARNSEWLRSQSLQSHPLLKERTKMNHLNNLKIRNRSKKKRNKNLVAMRKRKETMRARIIKKMIDDR